MAASVEPVPKSSVRDALLAPLVFALRVFARAQLGFRLAVVAGPNGEGPDWGGGGVAE